MHHLHIWLCIISIRLWSTWFSRFSLFTFIYLLIFWFPTCMRLFFLLHSKVMERSHSILCREKISVCWCFHNNGICFLCTSLFLATFFLSHKQIALRTKNCSPGQYSIYPLTVLNEQAIFYRNSTIYISIHRTKYVTLYTLFVHEKNFLGSMCMKSRSILQILYFH